LAGFTSRCTKPQACTPRLPLSANPPSLSRSATWRAGTWVILDFGLARRFRDPAGGHLPQRPLAAFRGSTNYASLAAHAGEDLGRADDLWSWLYMTAELLGGGLPWRSAAQAAAAAGAAAPGGGGAEAAKPRDAVVALKRAAAEDAGALLPAGAALPPPLAAAHAHIRGLGFASDPDYDLLCRCLEDLAGWQPPPAAAAAGALAAGCGTLAGTPTPAAAAATVLRGALASAVSTPASPTATGVSLIASPVDDEAAAAAAAVAGATEPSASPMPPPPAPASGKRPLEPSPLGQAEPKRQRAEPPGGGGIASAGAGGGAAADGG